jgi:hypothetical protein
MNSPGRKLRALAFVSIGAPVVVGFGVLGNELPHFPVSLVGVALWAVLLNFQALCIVPAVLLGCVCATLALVAGQRYQATNIALLGHVTSIPS